MTKISLRPPQKGQHVFLRTQDRFCLLGYFSRMDSKGRAIVKYIAGECEMPFLADKVYAESA